MYDNNNVIGKLNVLNKQAIQQGYKEGDGHDKHTLFIINDDNEYDIDEFNMLHDNMLGTIMANHVGINKGDTIT